MKKILILAFISLLGTCNLLAQIQLYPFTSGDLMTKNETAAKVLTNRLQMLITKGGMVSSNVQGRFILAAKVDILQRELTPTAPQQNVLVLQVSLAVGDGYTGTCFENSIIEVKGVGPSEERALLNAIKQMKASDMKSIEMIANTYNKIVEYYEKNAPQIIASSKVKITSGAYEEACAMLYAIPSECSHYPESCKLLEQAIRTRTNKMSEQVVAEAEAAWAGNPSPENAEAVMTILVDVDTSSPAYAKAQALKKKVETRIVNLEARERQDRINSEKRQMALESQRISENGKTRRAIANAAAQVASAYYKSHKVTYHVRSWW